MYLKCVLRSFLTYKQLISLDESFSIDGTDSLANEGLLVVLRLSSSVESPKAILDGLDNQMWRSLTLPGCAIDQLREARGIRSVQYMLSDQARGKSGSSTCVRSSHVNGAIVTFWGVKWLVSPSATP